MAFPSLASLCHGSAHYDAKTGDNCWGENSKEQEGYKEINIEIPECRDYIYQDQTYLYESTSQVSPGGKALSIFLFMIEKGKE
jgi:hypothetical protein